jgi:hypothetical protein
VDYEEQQEIESKPQQRLTKYRSHVKDDIKDDEEEE